MRKKGPNQGRKRVAAGKSAARKPVADGKPGAVSNAVKAGKREYREMTVALIREAQGMDVVQVAFSESARFYRLERNNPEFARILQELREAKEKRRALRVLMKSPEDNIIENTQATG
jgi:hypothetical protein